MSPASSGGTSSSSQAGEVDAGAGARTDGGDHRDPADQPAAGVAEHAGASRGRASARRRAGAAPGGRRRSSSSSRVRKAQLTAHRRSSLAGRADQPGLAVRAERVGHGAGQVGRELVDQVLERGVRHRLLGGGAAGAEDERVDAGLEGVEEGALADSGRSVERDRDALRKEVTRLREQGDTTHDPRHHGQGSHANGSGIPLARGARRGVAFRSEQEVSAMADKGSSRRPAGQDLEASSPDRIRNVVLVGPGGSGKTTLVETLLASAGAVPRAGSVREGTTVCDFEESEHAHERSISLAVAPAGPRRHQGQPGRHPRVRRLRGRAAGRAPRRRLRAVRDRRQRRRRRRHPLAVARVRRRRHAARGDRHQARPGPRRLRRRARPGAGGVRRQGDAALPARSARAARSSRSTGLLAPGDADAATPRSCAAS